MQTPIRDAARRIQRLLRLRPSGYVRLAGRREHEVVAFADTRSPFKDQECGVRQRNDMLDVVLGARARERPNPGGKVDLDPPHTPDLVAPRAGQNQQLYGVPEWVRHSFRSAPDARKLVVGQDTIALRFVA